VPAADYLNAPFGQAGYELFISELTKAERVIKRDFERKELFRACQPVEEVARTGLDALRFGPLRPVGLTDPATGRRPWAVVQLRTENHARSSYNLVGFQTNLTFSEQQRVFRMIPGLQQAEFVRYGVMHRNTFINAPLALGPYFELPSRPDILFAGQLTGTEGYVEAIASGLLAALNAYAQICGTEPVVLPPETCFGALVAYATNPATKDYQPMHVNFGIMPPLDIPVRKKELRHAAFAERSKEMIERFVAQRSDLYLQPPFGLPVALGGNTRELPSALPLDPSTPRSALRPGHQGEAPSTSAVPPEGAEEPTAGSDGGVGPHEQ